MYLTNKGHSWVFWQHWADILKSLIISCANQKFRLVGRFVCQIKLWHTDPKPVDYYDEKMRSSLELATVNQMYQKWSMLKVASRVNWQLVEALGLEREREKIYFQVLNIDDIGLEMLHKIKTWWCIMINTDPLPDAPVSFKSMCITAASSAVWIILIARALYIM